MVSSTPVTDYLEEQGIPHTLHLHGHPVRSLQQAAEERGLQPSQIVRSLLFRCENERYVLVLMPGPGKVSWPKLRHHLGVSRLTTATADQVREMTGYEPGAVSPFGLPQPIPLLADRRLLEQETVSLGAGIRDAGVILKTQDLIKALHPELGDFTQE